MKKKQIYLIFLIFGISTLFFTCDKGEVEYFLKTEFIYDNKTDKTLSFLVRPPSGRKKILVISPKSMSETINYDASGGFENPTPENCCQGLLEGLLGGAGIDNIDLKIDSTTCLLGTPTDINNYESEVISDRHYKYTFTFTDKVLEDKKDCN